MKDEVYATNLVQTRLSIEQCNIPIDDMPLDDITIPQPICDSIPIPKLQILLEPIAPRRDIIRSRMDITPIPHRLLQLLNVVAGDAFGVCEDLRDALRHRDFVDPKIRVGRDDRAPRKVDTFPGEVTTEPTLFSLETLTEPADGFLAHL